MKCQFNIKFQYVFIYYDYLLFFQISNQIQSTRFESFCFIKLAIPIPIKMCIAKFAYDYPFATDRKSDFLWIINNLYLILVKPLFQPGNDSLTCSKQKCENIQRFPLEFD